MQLHGEHLLLLLLLLFNFHLLFLPLSKAPDCKNITTHLKQEVRCGSDPGSAQTICKDGDQTSFFFRKTHTFWTEACLRISCPSSRLAERYVGLARRLVVTDFPAPPTSPFFPACNWAEQCCSPSRFHTPTQLETAMRAWRLFFSLLTSPPRCQIKGLAAIKITLAVRQRAQRSEVRGQQAALNHSSR